MKSEIEQRLEQIEERLQRIKQRLFGPIVEYWESLQAANKSEPQGDKAA